MDRTRGDAAVAREVEMNQQKSMFAQWLRAAGVSLLAFGAAAAAHAQNAIESVTSSMQSGAEVIRIDLTQPLTARADRLRHPDAGAHRARLPGRDERHRPLGDRRQPGQPALGQRGAGRRTHAPGAEPQAGDRLQGRDPGQVAAGLAGARCRVPRWSLRRPRRSPRTATATPCRCATSTSASARTTPAA